MNLLTLRELIEKLLAEENFSQNVLQMQSDDKTI
jgi:hypothetical protein